jgi:hypothetical protein
MTPGDRKMTFVRLVFTFKCVCVCVCVRVCGGGSSK